MTVRIRLKRQGRKNRPFYHIVAADQKSRRDGKSLEKLGYYNPLDTPSTINIKEDRVRYWYSKGAQLSGAVGNMVKKLKIELSREATVQAKKA